MLEKVPGTSGICSKSGPGGSPERPESLRDSSGEHPSQKKQKKSEKVAQKLSRTFTGIGFQTILAAGRDPEIEQKRARAPKSAPGDVAGCDFCRFLAPLLFAVGLGIDFRRVWPLKIVLPPQREHDFDEITVFEKTPKSVLSGDLFWNRKLLKIDAGVTRNRQT